VDGARRRTRIDDRVGAASKYNAWAAGRERDGVGDEGLHLHAAQIERDDAAEDAGVVEERVHELPGLELSDLACRLEAAHLLVERVEHLLASGGAGERGAVVLGAAETAEVEQALGRAVERHTHAVEQE